MKISESRYKANKKYDAKTYDQIKINARKDSRLNDLIDLAAAKTRKSKAQYIVDAIQAQLAKDGVKIDDLPPISE